MRHLKIIIKRRSVLISCRRRCTSKTKSSYSICGIRQAKNALNHSFPRILKIVRSPSFATTLLIVNRSSRWTNGSKMLKLFERTMCCLFWLVTRVTWTNKGRYPMRRETSTRNRRTCCFLRHLPKMGKMLKLCLMS